MAKRSTDPKKKKRRGPSKPTPPRRATSKGLKMPKGREKRRAEKGAIYQSDLNKKRKSTGGKKR